MTVRALLIGVCEYPDAGFAPIDGATAEVAAFEQWLRRAKGGADGQTNLDIEVCTTPERTTRTKLTQIIHALATRGAGTTDEFFFYFSGHGVTFVDHQGIEPLLLTSDFAHPATSGGCVIPLDELREKLLRALGPGRHFYFIDACRNPISGTTLSPTTLGLILPMAATGMADCCHTVYSTGPDNFANNNAAFSAALTQALAGIAESQDPTTLGVAVTFPKLAKFLKTKVRAVSVGSLDCEGVLWLPPQPEPQPIAAPPHTHLFIATGDSHFHGGIDLERITRHLADLAGDRVLRSFSIDRPVAHRREAYGRVHAGILRYLGNREDTPLTPPEFADGDERDLGLWLAALGSIRLRRARAKPGVIHILFARDADTVTLRARLGADGPWQLAAPVPRLFGVHALRFDRAAGSPTLSLQLGDGPVVHVVTHAPADRPTLITVHDDPLSTTGLEIHQYFVSPNAPGELAHVAATWRVQRDFDHKRPLVHNGQLEPFLAQSLTPAGFDPMLALFAACELIRRGAAREHPQLRAAIDGLAAAHSALPDLAALRRHLDRTGELVGVPLLAEALALADSPTFAPADDRRLVYDQPWTTWVDRSNKENVSMPLENFQSLLAAHEHHGSAEATRGPASEAAAEPPIHPGEQAALNRALRQLANKQAEVAEADGDPEAMTPFDDELTAQVQSFLDVRPPKRLAVGEGREVTYDDRDIGGWIKSFFTWKLGQGRHPGKWQPGAPVRIPNHARIAILGDWGTGRYGAVTCSATIQAAHPAYDVLIHLGDVYYSGTRDEINNNFLARWPAVPTAIHRACNSNHEMYSGGFGYFDITLPRFNQAASSFCLENDHYRIIGLDTGYVEGDLAGDQAAWATKLIDSAGGRRVILLTHHQPFSLFKGDGNYTKIVAKLEPAFKQQRIFAWYWGHEHRCVLYDRHPSLHMYGRCIGHSGYPYFRDTFKQTAHKNNSDGSRWFRVHHQTLPAGLVLDGPNRDVPKKPEKYGPNGFASLELTPTTCIERVLAADGTELLNWTLQ